MLTPKFSSKDGRIAPESDRLMFMLASALALLIALIPPAIIFFSGARSLMDILRSEVEINALSITQIINKHPDLWQTQVVRMEEYLRRRPGDGTLEIREVKDFHGQTVARIEDPLQGPLFRRVSAELFDSGQVVGHLVITRSLFSLLKETGITAAFSLSLALAFLLFLKYKPMAALRISQQQLEKLAMHDVLTGLLNRFAFQQLSQLMLHTAARRKEKVAMLFMDLDKFKEVNDTLGHDIGDELLKEVAHRLCASVRECDIVARLGGDEFVVVLTGVEGKNAVGVVAEKIVANMRLPYLLGGKKINSGVSIGIAISPEDGSSLEELRVHADLAMYYAKEKGEGGYQFFTSEMNESNLNRLALKQDLQDALERDEFVLHYQPQIDVLSGRVCGVEALVRWQHPVKGFLTPLSFIAAAEENGLILPLGDWVLSAACRQLRQWLDEGVSGLRMSVNVSPRQFEAEAFLSKVRAALAQHVLPPELLELEITEGVMFKNPTKAIEQMHHLRAIGVHLSIDDFGTGYSSLSYLRELPVTRLKLDKSLIQGITTDRGTLAICKATIRLSADLGLDVVAEGVETSDQLLVLKRIRCPVIQGYYFSKPLPSDSLTRFVIQNKAECSVGAELGK